MRAGSRLCLLGLSGGEGREGDDEGVEVSALGLAEGDLRALFFYCGENDATRTHARTREQTQEI